MSAPDSARASYGSRIPTASKGGILATVTPDGPAARVYLEPDDIIMSAEGQRVRDVIDWQWLADGDSVSLQVIRPGDLVEEFTITREPGEAWGLTFTETVFDGVRTCRNKCAFCFMTQLPKGLRRALYLRDDDFRLSFLQGNFITLTNLTPEDVTRIAEQHLSPLYVSLHAVDPEVRKTLVCAKEDRALKRFDQLIEAGIDIHVQIVAVPGVNDGVVLEETLTWLAEREGIASVGIVPLGFTAHQQRFTGSYEDPATARALIAAIEPWQEAFRERDKITWVHLADEFYLNAGIDVPPADTYDGYPQYENGIGLVRSYLDETAELADAISSAVSGVMASRTAENPVILISGELFAPVLKRVLASFGAMEPAICVLPVENLFFGGNVSVTGLLVGADLLPAIAGLPESATVLLPDAVVNADGLLLDDVAASELGKRTGRDVRLLSCTASGLLDGLNTAVDDPHQTLKE